MKALGFRQFRTRFHGEMVRIEIAREELPKAMTIEMADKLTAIFKKLGYKYVALDLEGYRQGSLNEVYPSRNPIPDTDKAHRPCGAGLRPCRRASARRNQR